MLQLRVRTLSLHHSATRVRSLVYILTGASFARLGLCCGVNFVSVCIRISMVVRLRHTLEGLELIELLLSRVATDDPFGLEIGLGVLLSPNRLLLLLLIIHELLHICHILMRLRRLYNT